MKSEIMSKEQLEQLDKLLMEDEIYRKDLAAAWDLELRLELFCSPTLKLLLQDYTAIHHSLAERKAEIAWLMGKEEK